MVWLGVVLGWFSVGVVMCEGGVIIWFGWVIGMKCGVVGVFACRVGVVVGVCVTETAVRVGRLQYYRIPILAARAAPAWSLSY